MLLLGSRSSIDGNTVLTLWVEFASGVHSIRCSTQFGFFGREV